MPITALPTPPSRQDPTNFNDRADAFLGALPQFQSEANELQVSVNTSEVNSVNSAAAVLAATNIVMWVSGTTYAQGVVVWSPINGLGYRRITTSGSGTTDPSLDNTNYKQVNGTGDVSTVGNQTIGGTKTFSNTIVGDITGRSANTRLGGGNVASNIANGVNALNSNTIGDGNTAIGSNALYSNTQGFNNTAIGKLALYYNVGAGSPFFTGNNNTAVGVSALYNCTQGEHNTAIGDFALGNITTESNCSAIGYNALTTASHQVQLGNSITTTYVYGTVQNRSDLRDKTEVRDTVLGLDFINSLRPVDYKWDLRDDYKPDRPEEPAETATEEEKAQYKILIQQWVEDCKAENITRDGSKKRNRYHHGLIAQEVKSVIDAKGIDFGGYQDHKLAGGQDVLSIGYDELIAPLIKAVQELTKKVQDLEKELAAK